MAEDNFGWLFVDNVPLLYEKKRVAKQIQIETWLNLAQLVKELGIQDMHSHNQMTQNAGYVV